MLGWCWVTRGGWRGREAAARDPLGAVAAAAKALALGVASTVALLALLIVADQLVAEALGLPTDPAWRALTGR